MDRVCQRQATNDCNEIRVNINLSRDSLSLYSIINTEVIKDE